MPGEADRRIEDWRRTPAAELAEMAWRERMSNFPARLFASAPGAKRYHNAFFASRSRSFVNLTVTGEACALGCDHCRGKLLQTMVSVADPAELVSRAEDLRRDGAKGVLLSGGCTSDGRVPLDGHLEAIAKVKEMGLTVLVHGGLVERETARGLKAAGVDQVLLDVIGDEETIRQVYHLDRTPDDYRRTLEILREEELEAVPHIVLGLKFGRLGGEYRALEMITSTQPAHIVLVSLQPLPGTPMEAAPVTAGAELGRLAAIARLLNRTVPISLGCARPAGEGKDEMEIGAVAAGVNGVAYPAEGTVRYARGRGLEVEFAEVCCSLLGARQA